MNPRCAALALTSFWREGQLLLVRKSDAVRLCGTREWEQLPRKLAEAQLTSPKNLQHHQVMSFALAAGLVSSGFEGCDAFRTLRVLRQAVANGELAVVRRCLVPRVAEPSKLAKQRQLVRAIEGLAGPLLHEGRRYSLAAADDLAQLGDRNRYAVVPREEAEAVLDALVEHAQSHLAVFLVEARRSLSKDWRPPFAPDGLVLLRVLAALATPYRLDLPELERPRRNTVSTPEVETAQDEAVVSDDRQAQLAEASIESARHGVPFCELFAPAVTAADDSEADVYLDDDQDLQAQRLATASRQVIPFCEVCRTAARQSAVASALPPAQTPADDGEADVYLDDDQDVQAQRLAMASQQVIPFCEVCRKAARKSIVAPPQGSAATAAVSDDSEGEIHMDDDQDLQAQRLATASQQAIPFCEVCRKAAAG